MGEWCDTTLGELVLLQRGIDLPERLRRPGRYAVLGSNGPVGSHDEAPVRGPGVVIGRATNLGRPTYWADDFWPLNTCLYVKDFRGADPRFVHYLFESLDLSGFDSGSVQPMLNRNYIAGVPLRVPAVAEQRAIAGVLGALDDKIESNRRLWSLALDLLDGALLEVAASNDTTPRSLGEVVDFNLSTLKPGSPDSELVYVDIASVSPGVINNRQRLTWGDAPSRARRGVADGDIIFSTVRPGRRSFSVILDPVPGTVASTGFAVMTPLSIGTAFLLGTVADPAFAEYCENVSQGSAYPAVSPEAMSKYEVLVPDDAAIGSLESEMMPVLRRGHRALTENEVLTELRDALLPELLSGRLRVREAEGVLEGSV